MEIPLKLLDILPEQLPQFDAIIVDEGQDFRPEWLAFLQRLLEKRDDSHYAVLLDAKQDIFGHWKDFPCSPAPARKVLTKNCRNTRTIVEFLNRNYPTGMVSFERSPIGAQVVERVTRNDADGLEQITNDVKYLTAKEKVDPGAIVILIRPSKDESVLRNVTKIDRFSLRSTYERYDSSSRDVYYSTIKIFKGLEAGVVLLSLGNAPQDSVPRLLYVEGSRAKHLLYIYRRG